MKFIVICKAGRKFQTNMQIELYKKGYNWIASSIIHDHVLDIALEEHERVAYFINDNNQLQFCGECETKDFISYCKSFGCPIFYDKIPSNLMETE